MSFKRNENDMYMMPVNFGPCGGPRRKPDGTRFVYNDYIQYNAYGVIAEAENTDSIIRYLPKEMSLNNNYFYVCVDWLYEIPWLGKKQYALMYFLFNVKVETENGFVNGQFASVVWENHMDPIITGRDQLGYNKIFCDISKPQKSGDKTDIIASEYGNDFLKFHFDSSKEPQYAEELNEVLGYESDGLIHYKYIPRAETPFTNPDVNYLTITPPASEMPEDYKAKPAKEMIFETMYADYNMNGLTWEQSPCHTKIISGLSDIRPKKILGGFYSYVDAIDDLYDQHIIKEM